MSLQLRIPPPIWLLLCGGLMWLLHRSAPLASVFEAPATRAGWVFVVLGASIIITAMAQFRSAQTTINPLTPAKASTLVRSGIFGYSRNPMYLGLVLILCGWAVVLGSLSPWIVIPSFVLLLTWLQIKPEEVVLATLFGREYDDYCAHVGRWFGQRG